MDSGNDLNDVTYDAFLANKKTLAAPDVISVQPSKKGKVTNHQCVFLHQF